MTAFPAPVVATAGSDDPAAPLVVLLHGRGSSEREVVPLVDESGAATTARRDPGGHGITAAALETVGDWLSECGSRAPASRVHEAPAVGSAAASGRAARGSA